MSEAMNRRGFLKQSLRVSAGGALALGAGAAAAQAEDAAKAPAAPAADALPQGKVGSLSVSRILLGGNLLTHYTHSRDLQYV